MAKGDKKDNSSAEIPCPPDNQIGVSVRYDNVGLPDAIGVITPDSYGPIAGVNNDGRIMFNIPASIPFPDWGYTILVTCDGFIPYTFRIDPKHDGQSFDIDLVPANPHFTREQICNPKITLSGLTIRTNQFGTQPWFELAYQCLENADDRKAVRDQKRQAGDTAIILEFFTNSKCIYPSNTWLNNCYTRSAEAEPDWFRSLVLEVLQDGFVPVVVFDGDNGMNFMDGYPNALRQLPLVVNCLADLSDSILFARFWDGVFYGSTPESIQNFGRTFRSYLPNGHLAIEFNPGHIPFGNGPADYEPNGMMVDYDVVVAEFDWPAPISDPPRVIGAQWNEEHNVYSPVFDSDPSIWQNMWQVCGRLVENYQLPHNQPNNVPAKAVDGPRKDQTVYVSADSYPAIYYLKTGNSRGKYYFWAFECGEYEWTRNRNSYNELRDAGNYFRAMNCQMVGMP